MTSAVARTHDRHDNERNTMNEHVLKVDERWFDRIEDGSKTAEVRKHDRDYQIGDRLIFVRESWDDQMRRRDTVRVIEATVSHILPASVFPEGIQGGYSVLSLVDVGCVRDHDAATVLTSAAPVVSVSSATEGGES